MPQPTQSEQTPAEAKPVFETAYPYGPRPAVLPKLPPALPFDEWGERKLGPPPVAELLVLAGCFGFNFLIPFVIAGLRREPLLIIGMMFGLFWAQLAGLCAVLVFGTQRLWVRLPVVFLIGYGLGIALLIGLGIAERNGPDIGVALRVFLCGLPLVALAAQLPLWGARFYFGWQIARPGAATPPRPLSIGDIFWGTAIAAASVALVRFVPDRSQPVSPDFWLGWAIAVPAIAGISLLSVLPAIYLALRVEKQGVGCGALAAYAVAAATTTVFIMALFNGVGPRGEVLVVIPTLICVYAAALWGLAWLARQRGYRLVLPGDRWVSSADHAA